MTARKKGAAKATRARKAAATESTPATAEAEAIARTTVTPEGKRRLDAAERPGGRYIGPDGQAHDAHGRPVD